MKTYNEYIAETTSEKIVLAHVFCKWRPFLFTTYTGNILQKTMDNFVSGVTQTGTTLTEVADKDSVVEDTYYFDIPTSILYVYSTDIAEEEVIVDFKLFYSTGSIKLPHDLDEGYDVYYEPRLLSTSGISIKISEEIKGMALVGTSRLSLQNTDGFFNDIYGKYIWDNKLVVIYSYNRDILPSEASIIYRGLINTRKNDEKTVTFNLKDYLKIFEITPAIERFDSTDDVIKDVEGIYKRRIFGRVDGMQLQSIDMSGTRVPLTGTFAGNSGSATITGTGTDFLDELTPDDTLFLGDLELNIDSISSNTSLTLGDDLTISFGGTIGYSEYNIPYQKFNRKWFVSPKALSEPTSQITDITSTLLFAVADVSKFLAGDTVVFDTSPAQTRVIARIISSDNLIYLTTALDTLPTTSNYLSRAPILNVYYDKRLVSPSYYTVTNNTSGCYLTFASDFEKDFAIVSNVNSKTYEMDASENIIYYFDKTTEQPEIDVKPRDWVSFDGADWFEVLALDEDGLILTRTNNSAVAKSSTLKLKKTNHLNDDSIVSVDLYGETIDGAVATEWLRNTPQLYKKIITEFGYGDSLNTSSFDDADENSIIAVVTPLKFSKTSETFKSLIDRLGESTHSVLTVDKDLKLKYVNLNTDLDYDDLTTITEYDIISWGVDLSAPQLYSDHNTEYRFKEINYLTEEYTNSVYEFENDFVNNYVGVDRIKDSDFFLYDSDEVKYLTQQDSFLNSLSSSVYTIKSDLKYINLEIGEVIKLDFLNVDPKLGIIISISKKEDSVDLIVSDLGNIFDRRAVIAPDTAADYTSATDAEKLIYGYITDDYGLSDDDEDTFNTNLIF